MSLGSRIKRYEYAYSYQLTPRSCVVVHRSNIDWEKEARGCGDPSCGCNCVHIAEIRRIVRLVRGEVKEP